MYNRYLRADTAEAPAADSFVPVEQPSEPSAEQSAEQPPALNPAQPVAAQQPLAKKQSVFGGLLSRLNLNFDLETVIVLAIALFLLCDDFDDIGDTLLLLLVIMALGV